VERHPYFDLWLHSTVELNALLPAPISDRETIHEWPLSCVQRLTLVDGMRLVYKAQVNEGVEAAFYQQAISPLLPDHRNLGLYQNTTALLLEYIDAPMLQDLALSESERVEAAKRASHAVAELSMNLPIYADLSGAAGWKRFAVQICTQLAELCASSDFQQTTVSTASALAAWANSAEMIQAASIQPALAHADLSGNNIFIVPGGFKIIDWQFPRLAPAGFDLASLLENLGYDPTQVVDPRIVKIVWFVRLAWFTDCKQRLFPAGTSYDQSVAELAEKILSAYP
jgi:hypothetical protein